MTASLLMTTDRPPDDPDLLAHPRRSLVVRLVAREGALSVRALSREIAARERGRAPGAVPEPHRENVAALRRDHLPALAARRVVVYDEATSVVSPGPHSGTARAALRASESPAHRRLTAPYLAVAAALGGVLLARVTLPGVPVGALAAATVGSAAALVGLALRRYRRVTRT